MAIVQSTLCENERYGKMKVVPGFGTKNNVTGSAYLVTNGDGNGMAYFQAYEGALDTDKDRVKAAYLCSPSCEVHTL